jgi:hypothetical protein
VSGDLSREKRLAGRDGAELTRFTEKRNPERVFHSGSAHQPVKLNTIIQGYESEVKVT